MKKSRDKSKICNVVIYKNLVVKKPVSSNSERNNELCFYGNVSSKNPVIFRISFGALLNAFGSLTPIKKCV